MARKDGVKNFLKRARKADPSDGKYKFKDAIGLSDADDIYRVRLGSSSKLKLKVKRLKTDVDAELYSFDKPRKKVMRKIGKTDFSDIKSRKVNKFLNLEIADSNSGSKKIKLKPELEANNYYLRITSSDTDKDTKYKVVMKAKELPKPEEPPVTNTDTGGGGTPGGDTTGGGTPGGDTTGGGTPGGGTPPPPAIPADGNDSREAAKLLTVDFKERVYNNNSLPDGFTKKTFYLGSGDTEDYFQFDLAAESNFNLKLSGLNSEALGTDLDVQIQNSLGQQVGLSNGFGTEAETISGLSLTQGSYFIRVYSPNPIGESDYSLTVSALPTNTDPFGAGETPNASRVLDIASDGLADGATFDDFVGGADTNDYFKVQLLADGFIGIDVDEIEDDDIDGRTSNIDLQIIPESSFANLETGDLNPGAFLITSSRDGANKEEVAGTFEAGTYYIRIYPSTVDDGAFYKMNLTAFTILDKPALTRDINPGSTSSLTGTTLVGDEAGGSGTGIIYFFADDGDGLALWQSGGTYEDTTKAATLSNATIDTDNLANVNGNIFFAANVSGSGFGNELYVYDGSAISLVEDITGDENSGIAANPQFTVVGDKLFFIGDDGINGSELWVHDTTANETKRVTNINPGSGADPLGNSFNKNSPPPFTNVDDKYLYFVAQSGSGSSTRGIYQYDIANETVTEVTGGFSVTSALEKIVEANGNLYFAAEDNTSGKEGIWEIIGTGTTAAEVGNSDAIGNSSPGYEELTAFNGSLYFVASDNQNTQGIWRIDSGSFEQMAELGGTANLDPEQLTVLTNGGSEKLYFVGNTTAGGEAAVWSIADSAAPDTDLLGGLSLGYEKTSNLNDLTTSNQKLIAIGSEIGTQTLYFTASTPDTGLELFRVKASESLSGLSEPFANIRPDDTPLDIDGSNPSNLVEVGNRLYFVANNTSGSGENEVGAGEELWVLGIEDETP